MKNILIIIVVIAVIFIAVKYYNKSSSDTLAKCLKDKGVKFYGASYCGHCTSQKAMFNDSPDIPYIECTDINNKEACKGLEGYPTWVFPDGTKKEGELPLSYIKQLAKC